MVKNKAIFLDRDGTINIDKSYVYKIDDFEFIEGSIEALKKLQELGFKLIVISNQSGIDRGFYTKKDAEILFNYMVNKLKEEHIIISHFYYCPHYSQYCNCRKPKLELFYKAQKKFNIDFNKSYAIGDNIRDLSICTKEKVKGFLIANNNKQVINNIEKCINLLEAAKKIEGIERGINGNSYTI